MIRAYRASTRPDMGKVEPVWGGVPRLTIIVEGVDDVYRFARHLQHGQCEFADVGHDTIRYLRRKLGKRGWEWLTRRLA